VTECDCAKRVQPRYADVTRCPNKHQACHYITREIDHRTCCALQEIVIWNDHTRSSISPTWSSTCMRQRPLSIMCDNRPHLRLISDSLEVNKSMRSLVQMAVRNLVTSPFLSTSFAHCDQAPEAPRLQARTCQQASDLANAR
jgi:hypothetical protein